MTSLQKTDGNWVFITPIDGLELTKDIGEEIFVNRVTFVSKDKLPRIRKRLGIPAPISELYKIINSGKDKDFKRRTEDFFSSSKSFAVVPYKGKPKEKEHDCIRLVRDELNILSLSQLGWSKRRFNRRVEIKTSDKGIYYRKIDINKQKKEYIFGLRTAFNPVPLRTEKNWVTFHKRFFFFKLLKTIRGETSATKQWRTTLHRAAIMAGQSQNSNDLTSCFLWNVIVLEMLLTKRGENISGQLVRHAEYFLGWNEEWNKKGYEKRIRDIYDKRCDFVHNGNPKNIEIKDLIFTDDLIFNILNNIIRCQHKIHDIKNIFEYAKKYEAEKLLSLKSKQQFGKFEIMRKHYTLEDYKKI